MLLIPGLQINTYLQFALPILIPKLVSDNVQLRAQVLDILKQFIPVIKKNTFIKALMQQLEYFDNPNQLNNAKTWHLKEESLNLLSMIFLQTDEFKEEWFKHAFKDEELYADGREVYANTFDFRDLLKRVCVYLDNEIAKVRKAALEALAVISSGKYKSKCLQYLHEICHQTVFDMLLNKVETGNVYFINKSYNLSLPGQEQLRQQIEEVQSSAWQRKMDEYKLRLRQEEEEKRLRQLEMKRKEEEEIRRLIELQNSKMHDCKQSVIKNPSLKELIQLKNEELDELRHPEQNKSGIEAVKYDILVPVRDIPVTTIQPDKFGSSLFKSISKEELEQREKEMSQQNVLQKTRYLYRPKDKVPEPEESESEEEFKPPVYQL